MYAQLEEEAQQKLKAMKKKRLATWRWRGHKFSRYEGEGTSSSDPRSPCEGEGTSSEGEGTSSAAPIDSSSLNEGLLASMGTSGTINPCRVCTHRVRVYTMNGTQIGLIGVGEGKNKLTFPAHYLVKKALKCKDWIREATANELEQDATWWRFLDFQPKALIHKEGSVAFELQPMGLLGSQMQALEQTPPLPAWV